MFIPHRFKNQNTEEVRAFIEANSFGILVSQGNQQLVATHIPLELDKNEQGKDVLLGHIARANPQWKAFEPDTQVLAIFSGVHTYVSSSWYDHDNVPTWNYIAVHVYGKINIIEGEKLWNSLSKLVDKYEQGSEKPVSMQSMGQAMLQREIKGIVGFEIEISDIQAAYKLSQNRDAYNHGKIIEELEKRGDYNSAEVAKEMKNTMIPQ